MGLNQRQRLREPREAGMAAWTFEEAIEQYHRALDAFMAHDTEPFKAFFTRRKDAT